MRETNRRFVVPVSATFRLAASFASTDTSNPQTPSSSLSISVLSNFPLSVHDTENLNQWREHPIGNRVLSIHAAALGRKGVNKKRAACG